MALGVSGLSLSQTSSECTERKSQTNSRDTKGTHLSWSGIFTEQSFVVDGEDRCVVINIRNCY